MDRNGKFLYKEAQSLGLQAHYHSDYNYLEIFLGKKYYHFYYTTTPLNEGASIYLCKNKYTANKILAHAGLPVAKAVAFNREDYAKKPLHELIQGVRFPLVAKPQMDSSRGKNVLCNIKSEEVLKQHIETVFESHHCVQVEEFHTGLNEYRVLVLQNRVIGVLERYAASIVGDGVHSIEELITIRNEEKNRLSHDYTISPLIYDREYEQCLEEQGLSLQSIPPKNRKIKLCHTANTGRGGDILSIGKKIHPSNEKAVCQAVNALGLNYGGLDILCEDINSPFQPGKWLIIEVNYNPDTTIHYVPDHGLSINVPKKLLISLIFRHPWSYLHHYFFRAARSFVFKAGLCIASLLTLLFGLSVFLH